MLFARLSRTSLPHTPRPFLRLGIRLQSTIPYTATCPSPTCECAATPPDLDIDRKTPLLNTMATYSEQVVFCTGKEDWASNIEQEEGSTGEFVKGLKGVIGKGSPAFDVGAFFQLTSLHSAYLESVFLTVVCTRVSHSQTSSSPHPRYRRVISQAQRQHYSSRVSNRYQISRM